MSKSPTVNSMLTTGQISVEESEGLTLVKLKFYLNYLHLK